MSPDLQETVKVPRAHSVRKDGAVEDDGNEGADGGDDHGHDEHAAHASGRSEIGVTKRFLPGRHPFPKA